MGFKAIVISVLILTGISKSRAQETTSISLLEFRYGFQTPLADLKDRFGSGMDIGITFKKVAKSRLYVGADGIFFFGSVVREDVLADLRSFDGSIIGIDGMPGDVTLKERGYYLGLHLGKIFSTSQHADNLTGFFAQGGIGLLQHKIRVQDNIESIVALEKENLPGYDRLTNGPALHLAAGYHYQNPRNNFQFNISGDLYAGKTKSRRDFDYASGGPMEESRTDILAGITIAYVVSLSRQDPAEHIYY